MIKNRFIVCVVLLIGLLLTACSPQPIKTIGSTNYYVEVQDNGEKYTEQGHTRYKYELKGFNEDGKEKNLSFTANHLLEKDTYLQIAYKKGEVITYEEVERDDIPKKPEQLLSDSNDS